MTKKNLGGRPPLPPEQKKKARSIRLSDPEWAELGRRAKKEGVTVTDYIRGKTLAGE